MGAETAPSRPRSRSIGYVVALTTNRRQVPGVPAETSFLTASTSTCTRVRGEGLWWPAAGGPQHGRNMIELPEEVSPMMKQAVNWVAAALMLIGALMLIAGFGVPGLWISVIAIGIALMVIDAYRHRQGHV